MQEKKKMNDAIRSVLHTVTTCVGIGLPVILFIILRVLGFLTEPHLNLWFWYMLLYMGESVWLVLLLSSCSFKARHSKHWEGHYFAFVGGATRILSNVRRQSGAGNRHVDRRSGTDSTSNNSHPLSVKKGPGETSRGANGGADVASDGTTPYHNEHEHGTSI